ncbi:TPX2 (targeting protein for Xklp2) family protein [Medicago truncatula]|uniref:TPX2 (Targeting protein for Xklp2) family protein n=1 Tax=Medicago truncatula TaxID=3880 RepID=A0A072V0F3_MEDTR|nr:TPX2 (targeting protein for Xklp2) family protein [Medicago truncatula]
MAESSTCFVQSFSTHADTSSCVTNEGNPLRALGESISFGRFMSESLDWDRWSAFSQNRYVEEAEKYSKPGSVAAKKAYFEAHYKRKAEEKAAALVEETNIQANGSFDSENWEGNCIGSSAKIKSEADNIETTNEEIKKDTVDYQVVDCDDTTQFNCDDVGQSDLEIKSEADNMEITKEEINEDIVDCHAVHCDDIIQCKCDAGENDLDIVEVEGAEDVLQPCNDMSLNAESCMFVDNSNQLDHDEVHKNITIAIEEKAPDPGIPSQEVLALPVKGGEVNSSPKLSAKTRPEKPPLTCDQRKASAAVSPRIGIINGSKRENSVGDAVVKKRLTARSLHTSINLPSGTAETRKTADSPLRSRNGTNRFSASKNSVGSLVEKKRLTASSLHMSIDVPSGTGIASKTTTAAVKPRNGTNIVAKSLKSIGALMEKRLTPRSLHMSINLPSGAGETRKISSVIEHNRNKKIQSDLPKVHPLAAQTSTQASHGLLNQAPANLPSQGRRTERLVNKSVSGDVTVNPKLSPLSVESLKSSSTTQSNTRSPTKSSPFRFRSEERAIKRKEFLQKVAETKPKEEEKVQLRISKGKTEHTHKKLPQSSGSKSKPIDDGPSGAQSPSNQIRKISFTMPRSPRQVRQANSSSSTTKNIGNSWKPPISTNSSKRITEKNSRTRQSGTSLSKATWENASPNIQH